MRCVWLALSLLTQTGPEFIAMLPSAKKKRGLLWRRRTPIAGVSNGCPFPAMKGTELTQQLGNLGFSQEEESLQRWSDENSVTAHLERRRQRLMEVMSFGCARIRRRSGATLPPRRFQLTPSRCTTRPKLFLNTSSPNINEVAMVRDRRAEVVFVDSGSASHHRELRWNRFQGAAGFRMCWLGP